MQYDPYYDDSNYSPPQNLLCLVITYIYIYSLLFSNNFFNEKIFFKELGNNIESNRNLFENSFKKNEIVIVHDERRNKNKLAARKARKRKNDEKTSIEQQIHILTENNNSLSNKIFYLQKGINICNQYINKHQNIKIDIEKMKPVEVISNFNVPTIDLLSGKSNEKLSVETSDKTVEPFYTDLLDQKNIIQNPIDSKVCSESYEIDGLDLLDMDFYNEANASFTLVGSNETVLTDTLLVPKTTSKRLFEEEDEFKVDLSWINQLSTDIVKDILKCQNSL
jgi:hypothetical protein